MIMPQDESDAPPYGGETAPLGGGWILLLVLAIIIIGGIAMIGNRPDAGAGGGLASGGAPTSRTLASS